MTSSAPDQDVWHKAWQVECALADYYHVIAHPLLDKLRSRPDIVPSDSDVDIALCGYPIESYGVVSRVQESTDYDDNPLKTMTRVAPSVSALGLPKPNFCPRCTVERDGFRYVVRPPKTPARVLAVVWSFQYRTMP